MGRISVEWQHCGVSALVRYSRARRARHLSRAADTAGRRGRARLYSSYVSVRIDFSLAPEIIDFFLNLTLLSNQSWCKGTSDCKRDWW